MTIVKRDEDGEPIVDDDGHPIRRTWFKVVSVFDVAQTEGEPLPQPPVVAIDGDDFGHLLPALERFAAGIGVSVAYEEIPGRAGGYFDPARRRIVVEATKPANGRVRTLVHEIAHALGVGYDNYSRDDAEVIVESVSYIVCHGLGLDTSGEALAYIAGWGGASDLDAMRSFAETVDELATRIEEALQVGASARLEDLAA